MSDSGHLPLGVASHVHVLTGGVEAGAPGVAVLLWLLLSAPLPGARLQSGSARPGPWLRQTRVGRAGWPASSGDAHGREASWAERDAPRVGAGAGRGPLGGQSSPQRGAPGSHGLTTGQPHTRHGRGPQQPVPRQSRPWTGPRAPVGPEVTASVRASRQLSPAAALPGGRLTSREVFPSISRPLPGLGARLRSPLGAVGGWQRRRGPHAEAEKSALLEARSPPPRPRRTGPGRGVAGEDAALRGQEGCGAFPDVHLPARAGF